MHSALCTKCRDGRWYSGTENAQRYVYYRYKHSFVFRDRDYTEHCVLRVETVHSALEQRIHGVLFTKGRDGPLY